MCYLLSFLALTFPSSRAKFVPRLPWIKVDFEGLAEPAFHINQQLSFGLAPYQVA